MSPYLHTQTSSVISYKIIWYEFACSIVSNLYDFVYKISNDTNSYAQLCQTSSVFYDFLEHTKLPNDECRQISIAWVPRLKLCMVRIKTTHDPSRLYTATLGTRQTVSGVATFQRKYHALRLFLNTWFRGESSLSWSTTLLVYREFTVSTAWGCI